jgi:hypothetical protein
MKKYALGFYVAFEASFPSYVSHFAAITMGYVSLDGVYQALSRHQRAKLEALVTRKGA